MMRLSISNIAWDVKHDEQLSELLVRNDVNLIDVAPGKYFPSPETASSKEIRSVKQWWNDREISIHGMQSLLFGTQGLNVFGAKTSQQKMLDHLTAVFRIAAELGAEKLVFGSPRNRDRSGLEDQQATHMACDFFQRVGEAAQSFGVVLCLEPNPTCYGSNFMTTGKETAEIVRLLAHPSIKMQLDTGALTINKEEIQAELADYSALIGHIHLSEPDLVPIGDANTDHLSLCAAIEKYLPSFPITIEMLNADADRPIDSISRALRFSKQSYCSNMGETNK